MTRICDVSWSGRVPYPEAVALMERRVRQRQQGLVPDSLYLLEHPPVLTIGRHAGPENLLAGHEILARLGIAVHQCSRGGDITYHGPGQLIGYPVVDLRPEGRGARWHVEALEDVLIRAVAAFGIRGGRSAGRTGVWVGKEKIAAIGVRLQRGVTSHGFALNVSTDLHHFDLIVPCGLRDAGVTSIERLTGRSVDVEDALPPLVEAFGAIYGRRMTWAVATVPDPIA